MMHAPNFYQRHPEWEKSVPSIVFRNHISSVSLVIRASNNPFDLKRVPYFNGLKVLNQGLNIDKCRKLLWNAWSTEYAFSLSQQIDNEEYYKFSLHWNFPQAYYSVYLAMTAFHETQGYANDQHEKSIKIFGNSIKDGHYPKPLSFYSKGLHDEFEYIGLPNFSGFPSDFNPTRRVITIEEAHTQIACFLKSTREKNAEEKRKKLAEAKDKRFFTKTGSFRKTFGKEHWDLIYSSIPVTSLLNFLYRLRIKANYHDVESFINASIDFKQFNVDLGIVIYYMNFVHEAYLAKCIGSNQYERILRGFPNHLSSHTAVKRFEENISSIIA